MVLAGHPEAGGANQMQVGQTGRAAALILGYALLIGFTDTGVRLIARDVNLWQFHGMRSAIALPIIALAGLAMGVRFWPLNWRAVIARSIVQATAMLIYFAALGFLPLPQVAAGLFTAPIFVLLITRLVYGDPIGPVRIVAVGLGFLGVMLALRPFQSGTLSPALLVPVLAAVFYATGNIAMRRWCPGETAECLTFGFFAGLGIAGLAGWGALAIWPASGASADSFLLRPSAWPSATGWLWIVIQAVGSLIAVTMMVRAYQLIEASRASVLEYVILPVVVGWGWLFWGELPDTPASLGMVLIFAAGALIILRGSDAEDRGPAAIEEVAEAAGGASVSRPPSGQA